MVEPRKNGAGEELPEIKKIIDQLDGLLADLGEKGRGVPVIEKNVRAMKSFVRILQYGISDLVEVIKQE